MALQRSALTIQDGISAQEISRYGSSNAAESMTKVTGASVLDGKYVYIRGLGDRYSSAQLNGQQLPSTDPYRNSVQLDLIPSNVLDNLVASKTFLPDLPGNFTGRSDPGSKYSEMVKIREIYSIFLRKKNLMK